MSRRWLALLKWPLTFAVLAGLLALAYVVHGRMREPEEKKAEPRASEKSADGILKFAEATAQSLGLRWEAAEKATWQEEVTVYGRVISNPAATAEVRSPVAGMLRSCKGARWPAPGQGVKAGQVIGQVEVRIGVLEQLDLQTKLAEAQVKQRQAEEILDRRRRLVERYDSAPPETVTALQKDQARVQFAEAQLQLDSALAVANLWRKALGEISLRNEQRVLSDVAALFAAAPHAGFPAALPWGGLASDFHPAPGGAPTWTVPLTAPIDGDVTELAGQADTAMAQDGLVLRVVDFRRTRVRLDLPAALVAAGAPEWLDLEAVAAPLPSPRNSIPRHVRARRFGPAPDVDPGLQCARFWYDIESDFGSRMSAVGFLWRPGLFVRAQLRSPNATAVEAISVPATAVLNHQGRTLVYVRLDPGRFARREVRVLGRHGESCFLAPRDITEDLDKVGVEEKEEVVASGGQILLSEEFRSIVDND
jgi:hypothetical protein